MSVEQPRSAMVAMVGKPNVGKSTLVNRLLDHKLSITSRRPQTTRRRVMGVKTFENNVQLAFFDTPGIHSGQNKKINAVMNQQARQSLDFADIVLWIIETDLTSADNYIKQFVNQHQMLMVLINKIDKLKRYQDLLPIIARLNQQVREINPQAIIPLSARTGDNVERLIDQLAINAPHKEHLFSKETFTDQTETFFLAELIREKIIRLCGMEVPHQLGVSIERLIQDDTLVRIDAVILVEQSGQKAIVIGAKGQRIKQAGTLARKDLEKWFARKVMLSTWVKVKSGWSSNTALLRECGYTD